MSDALILSGTPASVPSKLGSSLPSGSKMQVGQTIVSSGTNTYTVTYPAFSTATQSVTATINQISGSVVGICSVSAITNSGFSVTVAVSGGGTYQVYWVAIGN